MGERLSPYVSLLCFVMAVSRFDVSGSKGHFWADVVGLGILSYRRGLTMRNDFTEHGNSTVQLSSGTADYGCRVHDDDDGHDA